MVTILCFLPGLQLGEYTSIKPEVRFGANNQSRVDFVLTRCDCSWAQQQLRYLSQSQQRLQWPPIALPPLCLRVLTHFLLPLMACDYG